MKHNSWDIFKPLEQENDWRIPTGFQMYCERINKQLGFIPPEVLEQWVYGLYDDDDTINEFGKINFYEVFFELQEWTTSDILDINSTKFGEFFLEKRISELTNLNGDIKKSSYGHLDFVINHWLENGTWLKPIIIIDSKDFEEYNYRLPFQLVEGHNRLAWMKYFGLNCNLLQLSNKHKLWVMKNKKLKE